MTFLAYISNFAPDLTTADLIDISTYGGVNPDRNDLALYLYFYKRDALDNDTAISVSNSNPLTVTSWTFSLPTPDGVFVFIIFGFPIWAAGTYNTNNCVYYNGAYYKANTSTTGVPGVSANWTLINDIQAEVTNLANSNVSITQGYAYSAARASAGKIADNLAAFGQKYVQGRCKNWEDAASVFIGAGLIESSVVNFRRASYTESQEIIDFVDNQF